MTGSHQSARGGRPWVTATWVVLSALVLLAPLVAMQFTDEVNWTISDFAFAGGVLASAGLIYELAARAGGLAYQGAVAAALAATILILWTTGAVGIIGSEANPGNLLYLGVPALAALAGLAARGRAAGMAWAMTIVAVAQVMVPPAAYFTLADPRRDVLAPEVFAATAVFAGLWLLSAWLFRKAARAG